MDNKDMPAMPTGLIDEDVLNEDGEYCGQVEAKYTGLTKREHFAGLAMQGLLANSGGVIQSNSQSGFGWCNGNAEQTSLLAIDCADSLLAQLDKVNK